MACEGNRVYTICTCMTLGEFISEPFATTPLLPSGLARPAASSQQSLYRASSQIDNHPFNQHGWGVIPLDEMPAYKHSTHVKPSPVIGLRPLLWRPPSIPIRRLSYRSARRDLLLWVIDTITDPDGSGAEEGTNGRGCECHMEPYLLMFKSG